MRRFAESLERNRPRSGVIESITITECELNGKIFSYKATVIVLKHYYREGHTRSTENVDRRVILNAEQIAEIHG